MQSRLRETSLCIFALYLLVLLATVTEAKLKEGQCEVCVKFLQEFSDSLTNDVRNDQSKLSEALRAKCKSKERGECKKKDQCKKQTSGEHKEERFCFYVGGLESSATGILGKITKPLSYHKPVEKICEDLKNLDGQICDLKYEKQIDLASVKLTKLKVKDLKKILADWGEDQACKGCAEKSDFVRVINELMPIHAPEAAKKRDEL